MTYNLARIVALYTVLDRCTLVLQTEWRCLCVPECLPVCWAQSVGSAKPAGQIKITFGGRFAWAQGTMQASRFPRKEVLLGRYAPDTLGHWTSLVFASTGSSQYQAAGASSRSDASRCYHYCRNLFQNNAVHNAH